MHATRARIRLGDQLGNKEIAAITNVRARRHVEGRGRYADIDIRRVMPTSELCRVLAGIPLNTDIM